MFPFVQALQVVLPVVQCLKTLASKKLAYFYGCLGQECKFAITLSRAKAEVCLCLFNGPILWAALNLSGCFKVQFSSYRAMRNLRFRGRTQSRPLLMFTSAGAMDCLYFPFFTVVKYT